MGKNKAPEKKMGLKEKGMKLAKIEKLPKDVSSSLPFRGITPQGIIETYPGTFTKQYHLEDINYQMAPPQEQATIFAGFEEFLNSFSDGTKWQFTIFNHMIDKMQTVEKIRIKPMTDGLNVYRQEMNRILVNNLIQGNNSIVKDIYLTVSVEDDDLDHATDTLKRIDSEVAAGIQKITKYETRPMRTIERLKLLYDIYNIDYDYRFPIIDSYAKDASTKRKAYITLKDLEKQGLSIKDLVGPTGMNFAPRDYFQFGDMYGRTLYLDRIPSSVTSELMSDLTEIRCSMLVSTNSESLNQEEATKLVKGRIADLKGSKAQKVKAYSQQGYGGDVNPELEQAIEGANDLLKDITKRNQKIIFLTFTVTVFAETKELLDEYTEQVKSAAGNKLCYLKVIQDQQEFAVNTCLPLCRNDLFVDRMYTSETASIYLPYKSREVNQEDAIFYGLNKTTKNMILYDRLTGPNYNGLIFGFSGSGKSFTAKLEMMSVLLSKPDAQIFVIDPQGEYYPLCNALGGNVVKLATGSNYFLNPMDLDLSSDGESGEDPIANKSDFVMSMIDFMASGVQVDPASKSVVDRCIRHIYKPYIEAISRRTDGVTCDPSICPTLSDLYGELTMQNTDLAESVCTYLEMYAIGSFKTFARRTNLKTNSRFVVYDISGLTSGQRPLGLHICINDVWNRMIENSRKNVATWFYIDEFHLLLSTPTSAQFMKKIWKMARKWKGVPTGITQNTEEIMATDAARAIFNNTSFVVALFEQEMDRNNLQVLLHLSDSQLAYISEPNPGHGLIYNGRFTLPFEFDFPKDTKLYNLMTTAHDNAPLDA